jgi:hypothetical protein
MPSRNCVGARSWVASCWFRNCESAVTPRGRRYWARSGVPVAGAVIITASQDLPAREADPQHLAALALSCLPSATSGERPGSADDNACEFNG